MPSDVPAAFAARMEQVLGSRDAMERFLASETRPAVRVNPLKTTPDALKERLGALGVGLEAVPFPEDAFFVDVPEDLAVGTIWEHQAGHYFSQDAASLLPVIALDPQPGERILDLCAAPGGKTTHIAQRMRNEGLLVANEYSPGRLNHLVSNLDRVGVTNAVVTQANGSKRAWPVKFDRVLVDAPCSNLGHAHTSWKPMKLYSDRHVERLARIQQGILRGAFHACREGGVIVYSTCTLEPRENEGVISWFLEKFPVELEPVDVGVKAPGLSRVGDEAYHDAVADAVRVHPGTVGTDGFFLARFRKLRDAEGAPRPRTDWDTNRAGLAPAPEGTLTAVRDAYGFPADALAGAHVTTPGKRYYASTIPDLDEALAMDPKRVGLYLAADEGHGYRLSFDAATLVGNGAPDAVDLTPEEARRWLAGLDVDVAPKEWRIVACRGEALGAGRAFGGRGMKSFVPKERRVPVEGPRVGFLAGADA